LKLENPTTKKIENSNLNIMKSIKEMPDKNITNLIESQELAEAEVNLKTVMANSTGVQQLMS